MNTDSGEIRDRLDIPLIEFTEKSKDGHPKWVELTQKEAQELVGLPADKRLARLYELRPRMAHNARKQLLKRNGLR